MVYLEKSICPVPNIGYDDQFYGSDLPYAIAYKADNLDDKFNLTPSSEASTLHKAAIIGSTLILGALSRNGFELGVADPINSLYDLVDGITSSKDVADLFSAGVFNVAVADRAEYIVRQSAALTDGSQSEAVYRTTFEAAKLGSALAQKTLERHGYDAKNFDHYRVLTSINDIVDEALGSLQETPDAPPIERLEERC